MSQLQYLERMTRNTDQWRAAVPCQLSAQSLLVIREVRRRPETWELLCTGDEHALFSWYALLLLGIKFLGVMRE